ncbi:MAG: diaminopimelate epimerase [Candidatus Dadabacteria bacterium]|nr:diaminopimelate epimerase [Candidatus Dadabacteria bacterium]
MNQFVKSHGLGNDYIVLDGEKLSFQLTRSSIELLCSRNYGIGSDGILLLTRSEEADFGLRILNPDGSEAQKSGNGIRILAKFLYEHGYTDKEIFTIDTPGGRVEAALEVSGGKVKFVTVEMGKATFNSKLIPVTGAEREVVGEEITVDGDVMIFTGVSVGNPHCVVFIEVLDEGRLRKMAPLLETHRLFPERINVQFAKVRTTRRVEILIWERGAGYTLASGSSSCAVAAACVKNGLTDKSLTVSMPGGELDIEVREDWSIKMRGPVEEVMGGVISDELLEKL